MDELRAKIEEQRKDKENTAVWMVGEQLLDIAAREPKSLELLKKDLDVKEMSLEKAEAQIKAWADKQKRKGNCVCVPPNVAENILREFYGIKATESTEDSEDPRPAAQDEEYINLEDFL